jgi:hypothetical protein
VTWQKSRLRVTGAKDVVINGFQEMKKDLEYAQSVRVHTGMCREDWIQKK